MNRYITGIVPSSDSGSAMPGISVADQRRRNRKITSTTSAIASSSVNFTSRTECRIDAERSRNTDSVMPFGTDAWKVGSSALIESTTCTVLAPGWRWMARNNARCWLKYAVTWSSWTLSSTRPTSPRRTGAPLR